MDDTYRFTIRPPTVCPECGSEDITVEYIPSCHMARARCGDCSHSWSIPHEENVKARTSTPLNHWATQVRKRDGGKCVVCGSTVKLEAHHIVPVSVDPTFSLTPGNGVCLCYTCHRKAHDPKGAVRNERRPGRVVCAVEKEKE